MFNLVRYFSLLSFGLIAVAASLLTFYYRNITLDQLLRHEQNRAEDFTRVFENSLWPHFRPVIDAATAKTPTPNANNAQFREGIARMMAGTDVIKVKLYTLQGLTVFSTDPSQIGESKANNAGFLSARQGTPISELFHRNQFDTFEGVLQDRDVISTYVPIYAKQQGKDEVEGVFEVYLDVTTFVQAADEKLKLVTFIVLAVLAGLYLAQLVVVRRAQSMLRVQEIALKDANRELDQRYQTADELLGDLEHYIYDQGYGPTNETLGRFIRELFGQNDPQAVDHSKGNTVVLNRTAQRASRNL